MAMPIRIDFFAETPTKKAEKLVGRVRLEETL
jgi:hypothetical protein